MDVVAREEELGAKLRERALEVEVAQLRVALERRTVIGQAMGRLRERYGLDADAAFAALSRASQNSNRKLYDVAVELAETGHSEGL